MGAKNGELEMGTDQTGELRGGTDPLTTLHTENVVTMTSVEQEIDIQVLAMTLEGSDYDPETFPGLICRFDEVAATMLIFRSGKIVGTGASNVSDAHDGHHVIFERLRDLGIEVSESPEIDVTNIVSTADLGQEMNLAPLAIGLGLVNTEYEPEQFPGLIYRPDDSPVAILTFTSGKVVITGTTLEDTAERALVSYLSQLDELGLRDKN